MARRPLIAGNWKVHKTLAEAAAWTAEVKEALGDVAHCDLLVTPPYTAIAQMAEALRNTPIAVGAQEVFFEDDGPYTGAVSGPLLRDAGATHVLIAHSERRAYFGESLSTSRMRLQAALRNGLVPLLCIGETAQERAAGHTDQVVEQQLLAALGELTAVELQDLIVAYEPVWAIGSGQVATPEQAQITHANLREVLRARHPQLATLRIVYGGSVKADNAAAILRQPDVDGALVGGASLSARSFAKIARSLP